MLVNHATNEPHGECSTAKEQLKGYRSTYKPGIPAPMVFLESVRHFPDGVPSSADFSPELTVVLFGVKAHDRLLEPFEKVRIPLGEWYILLLRFCGMHPTLG
jgi:hypothetical protein